MKEDSRKESLSLAHSLALWFPWSQGKRGLTRDKGSLALSRVSVPVFAVVSRQPRLLFDACHSSDHTSDERPAASVAAAVEGNECHGVSVCESLARNQGLEFHFALMLASESRFWFSC